MGPSRLVPRLPCVDGQKPGNEAGVSTSIQTRGPRTGLGVRLKSAANCIRGMEEQLEKAEVLLMQGKHLEAVELYLQAAAESESFAHPTHSKTKGPGTFDQFEDNFLRVLGVALDCINCRGDPNAPHLLHLLIQKVLSVSTFRTNEIALTMLGVKCLGEGVYPQAQLLLQMATEVDPDCLSAKENLRAMFDRIVNRWHFLMLNDVARNSAYCEAIQRAIASIPDCSVLDIGSGTGILRCL